jgi:hypothetical protein
VEAQTWRRRRNADVEQVKVRRLRTTNRGSSRRATGGQVHAQSDFRHGSSFKTPSFVGGPKLALTIPGAPIRTPNRAGLARARAREKDPQDVRQELDNVDRAISGEEGVRQGPRPEGTDKIWVLPRCPARGRCFRSSRWLVHGLGRKIATDHAYRPQARQSGRRTQQWTRSRWVAFGDWRGPVSVSLGRSAGGHGDHL